jgi:hypothetical protein
MKKHTGIFSLLIFVAALFTFLIVGIYDLVIPALFPSYKTYSIALIGVLAASLSAGYIGYMGIVKTSGTLQEKIGWGIVCAVTVSFVVIFLSLLIHLNVFGN